MDINVRFAVRHRDWDNQFPNDRCIPLPRGRSAVSLSHFDAASQGINLALILRRYCTGLISGEVACRERDCNRHCKYCDEVSFHSITSLTDTLQGIGPSTSAGALRLARIPSLQLCTT